MKYIHAIFTSLLLIFASTVLIAQDYSRDERVLFTVDGVPVTVSEFDYIYNKNNAANADYSEETLREYMDLYTRFKLKVKRARDLQMDTIPGLQRELAGYRRQLAESYLMDKEVKNRLIEEAYQREQKEVHVSHILFKVGKNPSPRDTMAAYIRASKVKEILDKGLPFDQAVAKYSEDPTAKDNKGDMGYIGAILPRGFYSLETAIYALDKAGDISDPVRSPRGYHILYKNGERDTRGEIELAHIFVRKGKSPQAVEAGRTRINKLYDLLKSGQQFEEVARRNSDDKSTSNKGGYIGFVKTGQFEAAFEDLAFSLPHDMSYSEPFESPNGFHILRRISKKELLPLSQERRRIENWIAKTERMDIAKQQLIEQIKRESNYSMNRRVYARFQNQIDSTFFTYQWKAPTTSNEAILTIGEKGYTDRDFADYLVQNKRPRMQMARRVSVKEGLETMYEQYVNDMCLKYEERNLEKKYPDFKALMREYEEGILLFELTKDKVWDRASTDSVGLQAFYKSNRENYMWEDRIVVNEYTIDSADAALVNKMYAHAAKKGAAKLVKKYSKKGLDIAVKTNRYEQKIADSKEIPWKADYRSELAMDEKTGVYTFTQIEEIEPPTPKSLADARGYIIADYQDYLEKKWVDELKAAYPVMVKDEVFQSLVAR